MTYLERRTSCLLAGMLLLLPQVFQAQEYLEGGTVDVAIVRNPFMASESILAEGLIDSITALDAEIALKWSVHIGDGPGRLW